MKILIYGLGKSGTTILLYKIKAAFERKHPSLKFDEIFEPIDYNANNQLFTLYGGVEKESGDNVICKALMPNIHNPGFDFNKALDLPFDKKVLICRDPRDRWLSSFFYKWFRFASDHPDRFQTTIDRLRLKEKNPSLIPMFALNGFHWEDQKRLIEEQSRLCNESNDFLNNLSDKWLIYKYEDLIDESFTSINEYLELELGEGEVTKDLKRVARSKKYGEWKNWFTDEDVEFFKPIMKEYLEKHNYDSNDWELNRPEKIDPSLGSDYMLKITGHKSKQKSIISSYISKLKK